MSSVFNSSFVNTRAPASIRRARRPQPRLLAALAGWLGMGREPHARAPIPVKGKNWEQHKQAMLSAGDKLLARARSAGEPLSLAVFDLNDLPELESVFGAAIAREVTTQVVFKLQAMAGSRGVVIRTDATVFSVLMPACGRDRAHKAIERSMGSPCCIELDAEAHELVLVPDFKVQTMRPDSPTLAEVYAELLRDIAGAQHLERRRQRYLQRERESHTRPADLQDHGDHPRPTPLRQPAFRPVDPTIPMPMQIKR
ncbi:hypothetical protein ACFPOE_02840 [Caenimonas terrae]|uniref:Diguanylate cyclase n=1 Tax=Caenimonas terrae TaxID=696074 RepID=A0ABW0N702_9BURK